MFPDGASGMGVEPGEGVPVLCLEAVWDGLDDGVGVDDEASIGGAHCVDSAASRVLQDAPDVPQGLVRRVVSAIPLAFLGCSCYAVRLPFLKLVAAGGQEREEVGVSLACFRCAGAAQSGKFLFCGPNVMDELL